MESCCTCATLLSPAAAAARHDDNKSEKSPPADRRLECCARVICGSCIRANHRFEDYCPYCQISRTSSALPPGLKEPPSYLTAIGCPASGTLTARHTPDAPTPPPGYSASDPLDDKSGTGVDGRDEPRDVPDTLHFLDHRHDSIKSLALRYGVPVDALRRANNITCDHLLLGRRTVLIPGRYYKVAVSLSPRPVEGEEEELRKGKIRRFMVGSKVSDYDVAVLYLEQADYVLDAAIEAYLADEAWAMHHPVHGLARGKLGITSRKGFST